MEHIFISLYNYFKNHRPVFWSIFIGILILFLAGASQIKIEEDITRFFPDDERVEKLSYVFRNSKFAERLVVMISVEDSTLQPDADTLVAFTERLVPEIERTLQPFIASVKSRVDDSRVMELFNTVRDHLPIFLTENDYALLDSIIKPNVAANTLATHYQQLISPTGVVTKKVIVNDPLGFSFIVLRKLEHLQYDKTFELYDNYIVTKDHRHLLFFIEPVYPPNETGKNKEFITRLNEIVTTASLNHPQVEASYFGATAVAVGNAKQIQHDTILTVSLTVVLLIVFLIGFFRKKRIPILILIPVVFGGLFSLFCIYLIKSSVSVLAIAAGSVILGIAVNYALHFLTHLTHTHNNKEVIKDLARPLTIGSATTVFAFLCLQFANAGVLRDVGLFAALSLVGAALCSLIFLPQLVNEKLFADRVHRESWIERTFFNALKPRKTVILLLVLMTPFFLYFAMQVSFNSDVSKLNYMAPELATAQHRLESLNQTSLSSVYVVSQGKTFEQALQRCERTIPILDGLTKKGVINKYTAVSSFIISDSLQKIRIERWNKYWDKKKKDDLIAVVRRAGEQFKFSEVIFQNFEQLLSTNYVPAPIESFNAFKAAFFGDYIIEKDSAITLISLANVAASAKPEVYEKLQTSTSQAFDRQMLANVFVEYVHADFNLIVTITSLLVFIALLISYGRIELALITFIPMLITWVWILGIMALVGIEFNIVNVMISTFIFGLGDDYSIFTMDGLQQDYKSGKKNLPSIQTSIVLSAITTISGLGVLIFAEHPALRSIAAIAIIGIICVFIMSQTIEPFLFRWLITNRTKQRLGPMTFSGICYTIFTYGFFIGGSLFLTIIGLVLKLIPFQRKRVRLFYHTLLSFFTRSLIYLAFNLKKEIIGKTKETFSRPSIIISNHSSFLDILLTTMLHPKLILLTNKWVWNSPVFGGVVRLADYYPVMDGAEGSVHRLQQRVKEGYSIVVFPEGTRSTNGKIGRFHKGAFYMAEVLELPISPLIIHGATDGIPKGTLYVNNAFITLNFLPIIEPSDQRFGVSYSERTKSISRYFKGEYQQLAIQKQNPDFFYSKLVANYLYKGPVLEWYMRIKVKLERNYTPFDLLIPHNATVLDLGCGYGFLCYMLHFISSERSITGVDYDEEKIKTAMHCYSKNESIHFVAANITEFTLQRYDAIVIADVLHYLLPIHQEALIKKCMYALNPRGKLIIRDGNADFKERHRGTRLTEFFSVNVLGFNKSVNALHFISGQRLSVLAQEEGFKMHILDETKYTSNVIFVIEK
jgi:1-acyl-sn-glycerol-3-phosphate acyltransferase